MNYIENRLQDEQIRDMHRLLDVVSNRQRKDFGNVNADLKKDGTLITDCDRWSDETLVNEYNELSIQLEKNINSIKLINVFLKKTHVLPLFKKP